MSETQNPEHRPSLFETFRRGLNARIPGEEPVVPVRVEMGGHSWRRIERAALLDTARRQVADSVRRHLQALGIPGRPAVELQASLDTAEDLSLRVHGQPGRVPREQVTEILHRLAGPDCWSLAELPAELIGTGIAGYCSGAVHRRPSMLLGDEQTGFYADILGRTGPAGPADPPGPGLGGALAASWLREVLIPVLDAGVSIGDTGTVARLLADGQFDAVPPSYIAERIINELRLDAVHIRLSGPTLRWLTTQETVPDDVFAGIRERLYAESGALFPDFMFTEDPELPPRTVAFGLNSLVTLPVRLPDHDPVQAVAACLESELRTHRGWFMCMSVVEERFKQLRFACPDLVDAILDSYPMEWITAVGRDLFREQVPTQSLKTILEHALDFGIVGDGTDAVRFNASAAITPKPAIDSYPDPRAVVSYLRQRSNEMLQESTLVGQLGTLFMLGPELSELAAKPEAAAGSSGDPRGEIISAAVRHQLASSPDGLSLAVRSVPVRSLVRELLEPEFPLIPVVATQEFGVLQIGLLGDDASPETGNTVG